MLLYYLVTFLFLSGSFKNFFYPYWGFYCAVSWYGSFSCLDLNGPLSILYSGLCSVSTHDASFYVSAWLGHRRPDTWLNSILGVSVSVSR